MLGLNKTHTKPNNDSYKSFAHPVRKWSNDELIKVAPYFSGVVGNISGWEDKDKEGNLYKDYFKKADEYIITNYSQGFNESVEDKIILDLTADLDEKLIGRFDVVFNHTVLEHIFDTVKAFSNMALMSKDIIITVAPFIQMQHETDEYLDYWRFTPTVLRRMHQINGMEVIYESFSNLKDDVNYCFFVGTRNPQKWSKKMPKHDKLNAVADWVK